MPKARNNQIANPASPLQLTASIINQRYCEEGGDYDSLGLKLRLRFKNVGDQKIILYKGSKSVIRTTVGPSIEDVESGRLMSDIRFSVYKQGGYKIDTPSPGQAFIILPPNGTFEKETGRGDGLKESGSRRGTARREVLRAGNNLNLPRDRRPGEGTAPKVEGEWRALVRSGPVSAN
jgi:hypothetical protein